MVWTSAVFITGSSLGLVRRRSKVVTVSAPTRSFRETYRPGCNLIWSMVKLVIFSMAYPFFSGIFKNHSIFL